MSRTQPPPSPPLPVPIAAPSTTTALVPAVSADSYQVVAGPAAAGVVLLCDHAGNAFPDGYGTLGMPSSELARHIAYDIGAAGVTRELARLLAAPAVLSRYSRLLIDLNRGLDDPTLVMRLSDGAIIPGNRDIDEVERARRVERYFRPYHTAVTASLDACSATGRTPVIVSMHSFTDQWKGVPRPWHVGVLWDAGDARIALPLLAALRAEGDLVVGDNEPYRGHLEGDTLWQHGLQRGLPHVLIEIRQDLIGEAAGQVAWAARLARILRPVLANLAPAGRAWSGIDPRP